MTNEAIRPPSVRYQEVLDSVTHEPERATDIYRRYAELPEWASLGSASRRSERRWVAQVLENLAEDGHVVRLEDPAGRITFQKPEGT